MEKKTIQMKSTWRILQYKNITCNIFWWGDLHLTHKSQPNQNPVKTIPIDYTQGKHYKRIIFSLGLFSVPSLFLAVLSWSSTQSSNPIQPFPAATGVLHGSVMCPLLSVPHQIPFDHIFCKFSTHLAFSAHWWVLFKSSAAAVFFKTIYPDTRTLKAELINENTSVLFYSEMLHSHGLRGTRGSRWKIGKYKQASSVTEWHYVVIL